MTTDRSGIFRKLRWALVLATGAAALYLISEREARGPMYLGAAKSTIVGSGVELIEVPLIRGGVTSDRSSDQTSGRIVGRLVAIFADPQKVELEVLLNETLTPMAELAPNAALVVNAGYFTPERKPTGLLISSGRVLSRLVPAGGSAGSGVFLIKEGQPKLLKRKRAKDQLKNAELAIQAGPRLIEADGQDGIRSDDGARANRTAIGADQDGRVAIVVAYADPGLGPSLFELQHLLTRGLRSVRPQLELRFALNLDGGPSTGLHLRQGPKALHLPEASSVLSVLTMKVKP